MQSEGSKHKQKNNFKKKQKQNGAGGTKHAK